MRERILTPPSLFRGRLDDRMFKVLSADYREVLHRCYTMEDAIAALEREIKLEKAICPTGNCED